MAEPKVRIFFDMDGTLAEWRNIMFSTQIKKPEDVERAVEKLNRILTTKGYYYSLLPHTSLCESAEILSGKENTELYIITCVMPANETCSPEEEKRRWIKREVPFIKEENIIIVPNGKNKTKYVPGGIKKGDVLVDDFTKNLREWEEAGGIGVKFLNEINEKKGTWRGNAVSIESSPEQIAEDLIASAKGMQIRHVSPSKNREPYMEITEDFELPGGMER